MVAKKSSRNGMNYTKIAELINACAGANVSEITMPDGLCIKFGATEHTPAVVDAEVDVPMCDQPVDMDVVMDDNDNTESGDADKIISIEQLEDAIENLALEDPLQYEKSIAELQQLESHVADK